MHEVKNEIRPYAWGSPTAIPAMLGVPATDEPQAEMWIGAHPASPSVLLDGSGRALTDVLAADPEGQLGPQVTARFGERLPFLLKLLAAAEPLSLQAHPDPARAAEGYRREDEAGVPLDAPSRNYKDPYAKPEMICALSPIEALVGFRPPEAVLADLDALGVREELEPYLVGGAPAQAGGDDWLGADEESPGGDGDPGDPRIRGAFASLLRLQGADPGDVGRLVGLLVDAAASSELPAARLLRILGSRYPADSGVLAALLMNYVTLPPGSAVLLPSGNLHAYISGVGVELLANSDNVLRGGLTGKHVDIPELLDIVDFRAEPPRVVTPEPMPEPASESRARGPGRDGAGSEAPEGAEEVFPSPAEEFRLSRLVPRPGLPIRLQPYGGQLVLCVEGSVALACGAAASSGTGEGAGHDGGPLTLTPGRAAWVPAADGVVTVSGDGVAFRARVG